MSSSPAYLDIRGVRKVYPSRRGEEVTALDSVSLQIRESEFLALLGPSGSGKSTLLQIISGLLPATAGDVVLAGSRVVGPPPQMVYLFQQYGKSLLPWRTVEENVALVFEGKPGLSKAAIRGHCGRYLEMVGLSGFGRHYPWQLSGGMQQRVAIARALAAQPRVLLLDEPFSAVDALTRIELQTLMLDLWAEQKLTVIMVTHDVDEAVFMADRVALLSARPARLDRVYETMLPRPRDSIATRELPRFLELRHELLSRLLGRVDPADAGFEVRHA